LDSIRIFSLIIFFSVRIMTPLPPRISLLDLSVIARSKAKLNPKSSRRSKRKRLDLSKELHNLKRCLNHLGLLI